MCKRKIVCILLVDYYSLLIVMLGMNNINV